MADDESSNDLERDNTTNSGRNIGMGFSWPSFSNGNKDASNIKDAMAKSRAQKNNRRGIANDEEDEDDGSKRERNKSSELGEKEGLEKKEDSKNNDKKDDSPLDKITGKGENGEVNPLKKFFGGLSLKIKLYLVLGALGIFIFGILMFVGIFVSVFGGLKTSRTNGNTIEHGTVELLDDEITEDDIVDEEAGENDTEVTEEIIGEETQEGTEGENTSEENTTENGNTSESETSIIEDNNSQENTKPHRNPRTENEILEE